VGIRDVVLKLNPPHAYRPWVNQKGCETMIDELCGVFLADNGDYLVAAFDTDEEAEEYIRRVDEDWTPREIPDETGHTTTSTR
jgi:hypothetical protein